MAIKPLPESALLIVIEPDDSVRAALRTLLQLSVGQVQALATAEGLENALQESSVLAVISESSLPDMTAASVLELCLRHRVPVVFTGRGQAVQDAVDLVRNGALDYLQKPFSQARLLKLLAAMAQRHNIKATWQLTETDIPGGQRE